MDVVALLVLVILPVSGVVTLQEAMSGFADPNVILIAALFVVGAGLSRSGITHRLGDRLAAQGRRLRCPTRRPADSVRRGVGVSNELHRRSSDLHSCRARCDQATRDDTAPAVDATQLAGLVSGMLTLIATAPNLVVNAELVRHGSPGLGFFSPTPIGLVILALAEVVGRSSPVPRGISTRIIRPSSLSVTYRSP